MRQPSSGLERRQRSAWPGRWLARPEKGMPPGYLMAGVPRVAAMVDSVLASAGARAAMLIAQLGHITEIAATDWLTPNPRSPQRADSAWIGEVPTATAGSDTGSQPGIPRRTRRGHAEHWPFAGHAGHRTLTITRAGGKHTVV